MYTLEECKLNVISSQFSTALSFKKVLRRFPPSITQTGREADSYLYLGQWLRVGYYFNPLTPRISIINFNRNYHMNFVLNLYFYGF